MTRDDIASMLAGVGLPYAYDHFEKDESPGGPPFICFLYPEDGDFKADGTNYQRITDLSVELYTDAPSFTLEASLEAALSGADLVFTRTGPRYIESERMYQTVYDTSVLLTEAPQVMAGENQDNNTEVLDTDGEQG